MEVLAFGPEWLDPHSILSTVGLIGLLTIIFVETGLLVGFFLPGDSLLFVAGLFTAAGFWSVPMWALLILCPIAAIAGDQVGYVIGHKSGPRIFNRPDSRFFRAEYVERSRDFFDKYGARTIVIARFVPIVRTFAPVTAGVSGMHYRTFVSYNIFGGLFWTWSMLILGYYLGQFEFIEENIEFIALGIVALSVIPIYLELFRHRRRNAANAAALDSGEPDVGDAGAHRPE